MASGVRAPLALRLAVVAAGVRAASWLSADARSTARVHALLTVVLRDSGCADATQHTARSKHVTNEAMMRIKLISPKFKQH